MVVLRIHNYVAILWAKTTNYKIEAACWIHCKMCLIFFVSWNNNSRSTFQTPSPSGDMVIWKTIPSKFSKKSSTSGDRGIPKVKDDLFWLPWHEIFLLKKNKGFVTSTIKSMQELGYILSLFKVFLIVATFISLPFCILFQTEGPVTNTATPAAPFWADREGNKYENYIQYRLHHHIIYGIYVIYYIYCIIYHKSDRNHPPCRSHPVPLSSPPTVPAALSCAPETKIIILTKQGCWQSCAKRITKAFGIWSNFSTPNSNIAILQFDNMTKRTY